MIAMPTGAGFVGDDEDTIPGKNLTRKFLLLLIFTFLGYEVAFIVTLGIIRSRPRLCS